MGLLPGWVLISIVIGCVGAYVKLDSENNSDTVICMKCGNAKHGFSNHKCKCGGDFEFLSKLKWVEEK